MGTTQQAERFDVVFFGILQPGRERETVLANLASLFKTDAAKLAPLFAGGRKVIKGDVTGEVGRKYLNALENVGLVVKLEPRQPPQQENRDAPAETPPPAPAPAPSDTTAADTARAEGLTMAEVGADVLENPPPKPVQPIDDFSFLTMAEVGADVLEHPRKVEAREIDISGLSLADDPDPQA